MIDILQSKQTTIVYYANYSMLITLVFIFTFAYTNPITILTNDERADTPALWI